MKSLKKDQTDALDWVKVCGIHILIQIADQMQVPSSTSTLQPVKQIYFLNKILFGGPSLHDSPKISWLNQGVQNRNQEA